MFPDNYPYTNFHELNLGYFIIHFREIFSQWADLYDQMLDWKNATDADLESWKTGVEADLDQREEALRAELETWKAQTGQDIAGWEDATLAALTAWQTATQAVFEAIRVEAAGSATAAAASATDAATAKTAAETAQAAAEAAAASVTASAAQIATNTEDIADLKTQLIDSETRGKTKKEVTSASVFLSEQDISNVSFDTNGAVHIYGVNRFDIATAVIEHDGYGSTVITKTETGISVYYPGGGTNKSAYISYTTEFSGDLWISCIASTKGNVKDLRMNVMKNGTLCASCYGPGLLKQKISVTQGDVIQLRFLIRRDVEETNTVNYDYIMISYIDTDYTLYSDFSNVDNNANYNLPSSSDDWTTSTTASGVSGINIALKPDTAATMPAGLPVPENNNSTPSGVTISGLTLVSYNAVFNGTEGIGISNAGRIMLYVSGLANKDAYIAWLAEHTITISYQTTDPPIITPFDPSTRDFKTGERIVLDSSIDIEYYYKENADELTHKMVCFGDSITGMFGYGTDYPSMISDESKIEAVNCGFSGSTWTDYGTGNLMPFSINRLIESIVAEDYTLQDNVIGSITTAFYAEHLANLKAVDWDEIEYVTFLAGVNDWYYAQHPLYSTDDPSTENKQRTNVQDAVRYSVEQLITKYPHIKVILLTPYHAYMQNLDSDTTDSTHPITLDKYAEVIKECAEEKRIPHIEQYINSGVNQITMYYFTSDGTHPNEAMKHMIAKRIVKTADGVSWDNIA